MCDDWYRSPFDGACFGVLEASRLRPITTPNHYKVTKAITRGRVTHYNYGGTAFCQVMWTRKRQTKTPLLTDKEEAVSCPRCLDKFGRQDTANRGHGE